MWVIKWILAIYGYRHGGFWMMLWFFFLGTMIEGFITRKKRAKQAEDFFRQQANYQRRYQQQYRRTYQQSESANSLVKAYQILGISPSATDDEVRQAYRKHAMQNHPDRVAQMSEEVRQAAQKKFQEVTEAKNLIFKSRGI